MKVVRGKKVIDSADIEAVDEFLRKVAKKPMWETIAFLVGVFKKKHPEYMDQVAADNKDIRTDLKNRFGATEDKGMRHLIRIPPNLKELVEYFYLAEIKNRGEVKFWREFVKRHPEFGIPDRKNV